MIRADAAARPSRRALSRAHRDAHGHETRRTPPADPADAGGDARESARGKGDDRSARGEARRLRGRALPPLREQGADVRRTDRVHRDDARSRSSTRSQARRRTAQPRRSRSSACCSVSRRRIPGMTRVLIGDALVNEDERLQARMNQLYDRIEAALRQALRDRAGGRRLAGRPQRRGERPAGLRARPLAALREERVQARAPGGLGAAAQIPVRLGVCRTFKFRNIDYT